MISQRIFVLVCALLLALPGLFSLLGQSTATSEIEARTLAPMPGLDDLRDDFQTYPRKIDAFLDDHFGLRPQLLQLNGWMRLASSSPASAEVVVGRDGWMFYGPGLVSGRQSMTPEFIDRLVAQAEMLQVMAQRVQADGGRFAVMIAPDKHSLYPEQLPWWLKGLHESDATSRLVQELRQRGVPVVDARESLLAAKAVAPVFQRTDTHWTPVGANVAFNQLMQTVGLPTVVPNPPYTFRDRIGPPRDLTRKALMGVDHRDFIMRGFALPGGAPQVTPLTLADDPGRLAYRAERPGEGLSMATIGDSFSQTYFRELSLVSSRRLTWQHHRSCGFDWATVEQAQPDLVVYQVVARNLGCKPETARAAAAVIRR